MSVDQSYLRRINRAWYFRIKVPIAVRDCYNGREILELALHTRELDEANVRKLPLLARYKREFSHLRRVDPSQREAATVRQQLARLRAVDDPWAQAQAEAIESVAEDRALEMQASGVPAARVRQWLQLATSDQASLTDTSERWLEASGYLKATKQQHRHAVGELREFLGGDALPSAVTSELAVDFVNGLRKAQASYHTKRRKLNSLHALWSWMGEQLIVPRGANPWHGFTLKKKGERSSLAEKRGYVDDELVILFARPPEYAGLADVMLLGLYTGARLDEICSFRAGEVRKVRGSYLLRIVKSKTKAGRRTIAVTHRVPMGVVKRRLAEAQSDDSPLFPELQPGGYDGKLSWAASKAFGRYRTKCGLTRSTDFHSFRRTVITLLENKAAHDGHIASFVGHEGGTLARDTYSDGPWVQTLLTLTRQIVYRRRVEKVVEAFAQVAAQR